MNTEIQKSNSEGISDAKARLAVFARTSSITVPDRLLSDDSAPADELLDYCRKTGLSLDWLFLGVGTSQCEARDTPVLKLYRTHQALCAAARRVPVPEDGQTQEDKGERYIEQALEVEVQMMALPSICAADFAAKTIVDTGCGGMLSNWEKGKLWQEARALVRETTTAFSE